MKPLEIKIDPQDLKTPNKALEKAAKTIMKDITNHFKTDGWDLSFSSYVQDVFSTAFGHHLENYLLKHVLSSGFILKVKNSKLVITKPRKKNVKKRKNNKRISN